MVLGMGMTGMELARILRRNGMYVIGVARRRSSEILDSCDELATGEEWRKHLGRTDLCFLALPGTRETRGLFDDAAISVLPAHAVVVNVGRGETIDMDALQKHLHRGHLGVAAVDVLDRIPGPDNSLWSTPRLLITPKVATFIPERNTRLEDFIESQVKRYFDDKPPLYQVDYQSMEIMQNYRK
jgi:phosphoglycerate dehydrogenase-like enzyme